MSDPAPSSSWTSFADFLANAPPHSAYTGEDVVYRRLTDHGNVPCLTTPAITLFCTAECEGVRHFNQLCPNDEIGEDEHFVVRFSHAICRNCKKDMRTFALEITKEESWWGEIRVTKIGQMPPFGPPVPARVVNLIGGDRDNFLKGRRCESQGLGIGAFAYYRRVVEDQKNRLLDEIIKVAKRTGAVADLIATLEAAKKETQFSKAIGEVAPAVPEVLKISGHNPLTLLHKSLSEGLHAQTDEQCLELATAIRVVLIELSERAGQALKDEKELVDAVSRLMNPPKAAV